LAVINDAAENKWLAKTFGPNTQYWIGLTDEEVDGQWKWVDGTAVEYFNWLPGEPDNYRKKQNHVVMNPEVLDKEGKLGGMWNDISGNLAKIAIIERGK